MAPLRRAFRAYLLGTALLAATAGAGLALGGWDVPRVLFVHLPAAIVTFLACGLVFVASMGELVQHKDWWDDLAEAGGIVAVAACTVLLVTGMIWGRQAWGEWWTWSPRLTFSLILWALYVGFLALRPLLPASRRARVSCVYGILAFLDVPLVYMSTKLLPDVHPASIDLSAAARRMLLLCVVTGVMIAAGAVGMLVAGRTMTSDWGLRSAASRKGPVPPIRNPQSAIRHAP
jgi:heme exporter protein C